MQWRGLRGSGVEKGVVGRELSEVLLIAHAEIAEVCVLRIAAVRAQARQPARRFRGDDRAHRLARRVDEIEIVRLPAEVARRRREHVVGEHRDELRARAAEGTRHRRVHVSRAQVGRIELIDDASKRRELWRLQRRIGVHRAQIIAFELVAGIESSRIPPEAHALRLRRSDRIRDPKVLTHIVEEDLAAASATNCVDERVDVAHRPVTILRVVPRLVDQLDEQDGRLVLDRDAGVGVHVV